MRLNAINRLSLEYGEVIMLSDRLLELLPRHPADVKREEFIQNRGNK